MKTFCISTLTTTLLAALASLALAKPAPVPVNTVTQGAVTTITATVKNPSRTEELPGIVNIQAFDQQGKLVANLGAPVVVAPKGSQTVSRAWTAPNYATTLTWQAKIVPFREDPIGHSFGWTYPKLQHRMSTEAKNPVTCSNCHDIAVVNKDEPMSCFNCHGQKWY